MSGKDGAQQMCCASCGIAEVDDVKLKECDGCDLVRYCSDACQELHRPEHAGKCRKRAAELRDEILFRQPEGSHLGDCPLCCVPLPLDAERSSMSTCCSKQICRGCLLTFTLQGIGMGANVQPKPCPFCRRPITQDEDESNTELMKRIEAKDPVALQHVGTKHFLAGDYDVAFNLLTTAAELGDAEAHFNLSIMYKKGQGGVETDEKKRVFHLEEAAIAGHPVARHNLGCHEGRNGRVERAVKHWIIATNLGDDESMKRLKEYYKDGHVSKEDFAAALRAHHAAIAATKSPQREAEVKFFDKIR